MDARRRSGPNENFYKSEMAFGKFEEKQAKTSVRAAATFCCLKEQKTSKMFLLRLSLEHGASEAQFFDEFSDSLDFFFVTFFCIKTKESKVFNNDSLSRRILSYS